MVIVLYASWDIVRARVAEASGPGFIFAENETAAVEAIASADALLVPMPLYSEAIGRAVASSSTLKWIQVLSAGFDRVNKHGVAPGVVVTNASEALAPPVAVHALSLILALQRGIPQALMLQNRSVWKSDFPGDLATPDGGVLLIVGLGSIGREFARLMRPLGPRIIGVSKTGTPREEADLCITVEQMDQYLPSADMIMIATPLNEATRGLFGRNRFAQCKPGALLVNISRGPVVDTDALSEALETGRLGGAGVDVTDPEPLPPHHRLWSAPNVIITPHIASAYGDALQHRIADLACANINRFVEGQPVRHLVLVREATGPKDREPDPNNSEK